MKYNNYFLIALAVFCIGSLLLFDNIESAHAFLITVYDEAGSSPTAIARVGNFIWVGDSGTTSMYKYAVSDPTTLVATVVLPTAPFLASPNSDSSRLYVFATTSLYEIDIVNNAILRTMSHGCGSAFFDSENNFMWCATSTETINKISLDSMSIVFTSTTLNAGAFAIDAIPDLWYDADTDTLFAAGVVATNRLVAVEGITASGTPDFGFTLSSVRELVFNKDQDNIAVCSASSAVSAQLYGYTAGVGFSALQVQMLPTGTSNVCSASTVGVLEFDRTSNRFFLNAQGFETINVFDATTGLSLFSNTLNAESGGQFFVYNNDLSYIAVDGAVATYDWAVFDMTGIDLGSNGTQPPDTTGGVDCSLPENANILTCRLGGDGSLGGAGTFIVGSVNGTTGLVPIMCSVGLVDCVADPNVATNGAGYLIVGIAIAVWVGVMWVASRGDLSSIPTFLWFIGALLIVGAFTVAGVIDVVFFIVTIIFVCALAAAKAKGLLGGGF